MPGKGGEMSSGGEARGQRGWGKGEAGRERFQEPRGLRDTGITPEGVWGEVRDGNGEGQALLPLSASKYTT